MTKQIKNRVASVHNKLLALTKTTARQFNSLLLQYCQERLLYRLAVSPYKKQFVLKGGLLMLAYKVERSRPTKDIDFLGKGLTNDMEKMKDVFGEITGIEQDDGLVFQSSKIVASKIQEGQDYEGLRLHIPVTLGKARLSLKLDIGFGDKVIPSPVKKKFPVLLDNPEPELYVYTIESSLAEKFNAMVSHGINNSRMKDFFDILFMAENYSFKKKVLYEAIQSTFTQRKTKPEDRREVFSLEFMKDPQKVVQWKAFISRNELTVDSDFGSVVQKIELFIEPIFNKQNGAWLPQEWKWEH